MEDRNKHMPKRNIYEEIMPEKIEVLTSMLRVSRCRYRPTVHPWTLTHFSPPDWRLYYNSTPGGFFQSAGIPPTPFRTDRFYIFPKDYTFSTWSDQPFSHFYIHFQIYDHIPCPQRHFELPADPNTLSLIRECIATEQNWKNIQRRTFLAYAIIGSLMSRLPAEQFLLDRMPDQRVEDICELIENNLKRKYSNSELAEKAGLARNSFIRLFREKTGETPQQYRLRKCVEYACGELHYSMRTIDEIAEAAGFSDRFHFTRTFGRIMEMPPGIYRRVTRTQVQGIEQGAVKRSNSDK